MSNILSLNRDDPIIHLKAYSSVKIEGIDRAEVNCTIESPELATLTEEEGHVYITVNSACHLEVPINSSLEIERAMGSIKIRNIKGAINADKVLSNLVLVNINRASIDMIGGSFSVKNASEEVDVKKVAGSLTVDSVHSFSCLKVGGSCTLRDIKGECRVENAGGKCLAQGLNGGAILSKFGGSIKARMVVFLDDVKVGGNIDLADCQFENDLDLRAGGSVVVALPKEQQNLAFKLTSGSQKILVKAHGDDVSTSNWEYEHQFGNGGRKIKVAAGGSISILETFEEGEDLIGDISNQFNFKESPINQIIQERVQAATRRADAKVKAAEMRLAKIKDRVRNQHNIPVDFGADKNWLEDEVNVELGETGLFNHEPVPAPVTRPIGKKSTTNEERLMILKMLQDKKITVDEAEVLFRALEG